jgi:hypothetical protein
MIECFVVCLFCYLLCRCAKFKKLAWYLLLLSRDIRFVENELCRVMCYIMFTLTTASAQGILVRSFSSPNLMDTNRAEVGGMGFH